VPEQLGVNDCFVDGRTWTVGQRCAADPGGKKKGAGAAITHHVGNDEVDVGDLRYATRPSLFAVLVAISRAAEKERRRRRSNQTKGKSLA
jgi:hypothetical protein